MCGPVSSVGVDAIYFSLHPTPTQRPEMYKIASSLFLALIYVKSGNLDVEATAAEVVASKPKIERAVDFSEVSDTHSFSLSIILKTVTHNRQDLSARCSGFGVALEQIDKPASTKYIGAKILTS